jgi:hypothetical protein
MKNGIATALSTAILLAPIGGCDISAAPRWGEAPAVAAPLAPKARYQVDAARNRVWFLSHEGVFLFEPSQPERRALALPDWISAGTQYGCMPDLALGPRGEVVITSNVVPTLWRIDPDTLAVSVHRLGLDADGDKDIGFSGLVYSAEHQAFFAASYSHGSLWKIDSRLERAQKVSLSAGLPGVCGLALGVRGNQFAASRPIGLCARTAQRGLRVEFAPDGRSAYVGVSPCEYGPVVAR